MLMLEAETIANTSTALHATRSDSQGTAVETLRGIWFRLGAETGTQSLTSPTTKSRNETRSNLQVV